MPVVDQPFAPPREVAPTARGSSLRAAKRRVPVNVLANCLSFATNIVVSFLVVPLLVHRLGNSAYGVWGLIGQLIEYSFLLDFGIRIAVTRYVARHLALDQQHEINKVITTGLVFNIIPLSFSLLGGGVLAYVLPHFFPIPEGLVAPARWSVVIVAIGIAASFPGSLFLGCVAASSRYDLLGIRRSLPVLVRVFLLWYFLDHGYGLVAVATISTLTVCLGYGLDYVFTRRQFPHLSVRREHFDLSLLRTLLNFSVYAFISSIAWRLLFMTDNIVVGFALGPVAVTFYAVGMNLAGTLRESVGNITALYAPLAYQMDALDEKESLRRLFISGSRIALVYVLAGITTLVIVGRPFLGLWMGSAFVDSSGPILILLSVEAGFFALSFTSTQVLYAMNRPRVYAWLSLSDAAVNFALSATLVGWVGAVGVAWGTVIPACLVEAIIMPVYTAALLRVSPLHFYWSAVLRPLLAATPYGLWLWFCLQHGLIRGYASLALAVCSGLVLYALLAWSFGLDGEERAWARQRLSGLKSMFMAIYPAWETGEKL